MNKPYNAQIELVRGCNLSCDFCAIHNIPNRKKFKLMEYNTFRNAIFGLKNFDPIRIEFAMRGEPTFHPLLNDFTSFARDFMPKSQITLTTNGTSKKLKKIVMGFLKSGGNIVIVDCYGDSYGDIKDKLSGMPTIDYYQNNFSPWNRHPPTTKKIVMINDLGKVTGDKTPRKVNNQAGNVDFDKVAKYGVKPLKSWLPKKCSHPFREVSIWWNGNVSPCCRDWGEEQILYNVNDVGIDSEWFTNPILNAFRKLTYNKYRNFSICKRCDYNGGFRLGFLPEQDSLHLKQLVKYSEVIDSVMRSCITE